MTQHSSYTRRAISAISSSWFFRGVVALLVLQAAWIALTGRFPMAFDEDYHLGIIRLYAHHISPFWSAPPAGADNFGAVARDPSYLYQYLMSFPYRLVSLFTSDQTIQVLWLRAINIGLFASGLVFYRRLLLKTGASKAIVHTCLLLFVLVPVVPLLAAQINYDNLLLPLVGLILWLTASVSDELGAAKRLNGLRLAQIMALCMLASLVKYPFLPIFVTVVVFLGIRIWQTYKSLPAIWKSLRGCARKLAWPRKVLYALVLLVAFSLCVERYGVNLARYHTPVPDCSAVLSVRQCSAYGPWIRDHTLQQNKVDDGDNAVDFAQEWLYGMWLRLFFAVDGPATDFQTHGPFIIPALSAIVGAVFGFGLIMRYGRRLFSIYNAPVLCLLAGVTIFYVLILILDGYEAYLRTGQPVAINGRYLLPVLLPALLFSLLAAGQLLKNRPALKLSAASLMVACLLYGGGALTYILRSNDSWYWPNHSVQAANHAVQHLLGPITPGYNRPSEFLR